MRDKPCQESNFLAGKQLIDQIFSDPAAFTASLIMSSIASFIYHEFKLLLI